MKKVLKLGTRKSLLAWAQSSAVARRIESLNPGLEVHLVGIETRGDVLLDVPLSSVPGKEFFVAEIDRALSVGQVDLTVHSMKDLSLERPAEFTCAAVPIRENPRDVILFGPAAEAHLKAGIPLKIGTSSPRRLENIPSFLERALPRLKPGGLPVLEFVEIRGNVNTRLSRVHEDPRSPKYLDGVVLAFAGLIRLWADAQGRGELVKLLKSIRWMILPLKECPAAPAQGALAVECRSRDLETLACVQKIHHEETARHARLERQVLADWGGGCHQRLGATALNSTEWGDFMYLKGVQPTGMEVDEIRWQVPDEDELDLGVQVRAWDGSDHRAASIPWHFDLPLLENRSVFFAHSRAMTADPAHFKTSRIWTSGTKSWFKLAERGLWVEGCAESLGFKFLLPTLQEEVLQLGALRDWFVLTHAGAENSWKNQACTVVPVYKINLDYGEETKREVSQATHLFWSSGSQFDGLSSCVSPRARHFCGPGKTAIHLRQRGVEPTVFLSPQEWKKALKRLGVQVKYD